MLFVLEALDTYIKKIQGPKILLSFFAFLTLAFDGIKGLNSLRAVSHSTSTGRKSRLRTISGVDKLFNEHFSIRLQQLFLSAFNSPIPTLHLNRWD